MTDSQPAFFPIKALIFDLDGTLYRNRRLDRLYEESVYHLLAERFRISPARARRRFWAYYQDLETRLQRPPSKLYTLSKLGVSDRVWAQRHGRIHASAVLKPNPRLKTTLLRLARLYRLGIVTNNHRRNTEETLAALGVEGIFDEILTLSESRIFKPSPELYNRMAERLGVNPQDCLSVGDRYYQDLQPAAAAGMQTLLVQRLADIYRLPGVLTLRLALWLRLRSAPEQARALRLAGSALQQGRLVVVPTDTVYGLAAAARADAIRWLYRAKGRPEDNPIVLLLSDAAAAGQFAVLSPAARRLAQQHWPGALTMVLPVRPGTAWGSLTRGQRTVAVRVPDHAWLRRLIRAQGGALATTSANASGQPAPAAPGQVDQRVLAFAQVAVDGGGLAMGTPSTVVKVSGRRMKMLRPGGIIPAGS